MQKRLRALLVALLCTIELTLLSAHVWPTLFVEAYISGLCTGARDNAL